MVSDYRPHHLPLKSIILLFGGLASIKHLHQHWYMIMNDTHYSLMYVLSFFFTFCGSELWECVDSREMDECGLAGL